MFPSFGNEKMLVKMKKPSKNKSLLASGREFTCLLVAKTRKEVRNKMRVQEFVFLRTKMTRVNK
jgi:hypothetical protein